jgi:hypothetical protein
MRKISLLAAILTALNNRQMKMLKDIFLSLKQRTNSLTINPLLNSFDQEDLKLLDTEAVTEPFIAEKKKNILGLMKETSIDYDPKLKSAYDEYSEAMTYLRLKNIFGKVERIAEGKEKTPDFKIELSYDDNGEAKICTVYAELKSLSFASGNLNYKKTMEQGLDAQIDIEKQLKQGRQIGFGITEIQPLHKDNKKYDPTSTKYAIETVIEKIEQNIKEGQYSYGETVLIVDLKQLILPSYFKEGGVPIFQEKQYNSFVSGVQWNAAFGKVGYLVFKQIEFEGKENVDGELEREGVLVSRDYIKAVIFLDYALSDKQPKIVGLYKQRNVSDCVQEFLYKFCDFVNDEKNTNGWRLNE